MPGALLFTGVGGTGVHRSFSSDTPNLPAEIDGTAQSLSVLASSVPAYFYEQPNYGGRALIITRGGGCDNLASCVPSAGNWAKRIRSLKFFSAATVGDISGGAELLGPELHPK